MRRLVWLIPVWMCLAAVAPAPAKEAAKKSEAATATVTEVAVEADGAKFWLPGTITVKKGTKVTLKLMNNIPSDPNQHGFAIPAYNIAEVVNRGEPKSVDFTADKPGVFPIICQLHPAHVGGQLVVLP